MQVFVLEVGIHTQFLKIFILYSHLMVHTSYIHIPRVGHTSQLFAAILLGMYGYESSSQASSSLLHGKFITDGRISKARLFH